MQKQQTVLHAELTVPMTPIIRGIFESEGYRVIPTDSYKGGLAAINGRRPGLNN
jgi:hypothetical protein